MNEYDLDRYCGEHKDCDCRCVKCPAFAAYQRQALGGGPKIISRVWYYGWNRFPPTAQKT